MRRVLICVAAASVVLASCSGSSTAEDPETSTTQAASVPTTSARPDTTTSAAPPSTTTTSTLPPTTTLPPPPAIDVTSAAYGEGERIPVEFTCSGGDTQPPYTIAGLPDETVSIAVVMDAAVPQGVFTHWVQFDMPPDPDIPQDAVGVGTLGSGLFGALGYSGPCPIGEDLGIYTLQVFAVDSAVGLEEGASKSALMEALEGRVIGYGELTGEYSKG
jgi:Raf kinase inhibitor-like YbhB/YbcL family protein